MVKPSGSGKTRLVVELGRQRMFVFYICLRSAESTGFPRRSEVSDYLASNVFLSDPLEAEKKWQTFITQCFVSLVQHLASLNGKVEKPAVFHDWISRQLKEHRNKRKIGEEFWQSIVQLDVTNVNMQDMASQYKSLAKKLELHPDPVVFIFDEARVLLQDPQDFSGTITRPNDFRLLRRALRCSADSMKLTDECFLFALTLDTYSLLINFSPSDRYDDSLRLTLAKVRLYQPFWFVDSFDIFSKVNSPSIDLFVELANYTADSVDIVKLNTFLVALFEKGRPLWHAPLHLNEGSDLYKAVDLACCKLIAQSSTELKDKPTSDQLLAILTIRLCLFVDPCSRFASQLSASHMADINAISEDREQFIISYPSEPILAEAAAYYASELRSYMIQNLLPFIHSGMVGGGYRGEFLGRYLLLESWERASKKRGIKISVDRVCFSLPMKVREFLLSFSPNVITAMKDQIDDEKLTMFLDGVVCFNQILRINFSLRSMDQLQLYMERCAAILLKENERAFDIVVPVFIPDRGMTAILYQTRNYSTRDDKIAFADLKQSYTNSTFEEYPQLPYLALYSQFGDANGPERVIALKKKGRKSERIGSKTAEDENQMVVGMIGLSGQVYETCKKIAGTGDDETMVKYLRNLRDARHDPEQLVKKKYHEIINRNFVLTNNLDSRMELLISKSGQGN